jgi:hypothetical protein
MRTVGVRLLVLSVVAFTPGARLQAQRGDREVLTAEEIERAKANVSTAYDAVEMLRPRWFRKHELARIPRPTEPLQDISVRVYLNDHSMGGADYLKTIRVETVLEMRWLSPNEAASRFGPTEGYAAIVVTLKR